MVRFNKVSSNLNFILAKKLLAEDLQTLGDSGLELMPKKALRTAVKVSPKEMLDCNRFPPQSSRAAQQQRVWFVQLENVGTAKVRL